MDWPTSPAELEAEQRRLGAASPPAWNPPTAAVVGGCFACFPKRLSGPGSHGDPAWTGAAAVRGQRILGTATSRGTGAAPYQAGLLALREGALLEHVVRALPVELDVLMVNATGRDHPRRAGLALQLGARLGLPTVGVTHRALLATGEEPAAAAGSTAPLHLDGETVGAWLRTRRGTRPLAVTAAWRTSPDVAVEVVRRVLAGARTPEPLRVARHLARRARAVET